MRWFFLTSGILLACMSIGVAVYYSVFGSPEWLGKYVGQPEFYLMAIASGFAFSWAIKGFKGDPVRELVAKVIRESGKDS